MFGVAKPVVMPKPKPGPCPRIPPKDIEMPCTMPNCWAHRGSTPNSNQKQRLVEYKQKKDGEYTSALAIEKQKILSDVISRKFDKHSEKRRFQGEIKKRLKIRMQEYEDSIDVRRQKLRELWAKEEREYYRETIDTAQRGGDTRMQEMKTKAEMLAAKREAERQELLQAKRLQQYRQRCEELRTVLSKQGSIECRNSQLQQIRENQARREAEKEMDWLWHDINVKEMEAKKERDEQECINRHIQYRANMAVWETQLRGKDELKAEVQRMLGEDREELDKLREQMKKEELDALITKERKRDLLDRELSKQIKLKQDLVAQRKKEEDALVNAYTMLGKMELEKELIKSQDTSKVAKRELAQYRANLVALQRERKAEEVQINGLIEEYKKEIQRKQDEARCKVQAAKKKLLKDTLKGRDEQIKQNQELAMEQLKLQQAENEMMRIACETNERLAREMERQEQLARIEYSNELLKQIEYKKHLQQKEQEDLERQLALGYKEEERYKKIVEELCASGATIKKHPFHCVVQRENCLCDD